MGPNIRPTAGLAVVVGARVDVVLVEELPQACVECLVKRGGDIETVVVAAAWHVGMNLVWRWDVGGTVRCQNLA